MGYGISKTFLGFMDVMGYVLPQYEAGIMLDLSSIDGGDDHTLVGSSLRVPVGVRLSFNIGYPTRIFVGGGYAFNCGMGDNGKIVKKALKCMDTDRGGVFLNFGFTF